MKSKKLRKVLTKKKTAPELNAKLRREIKKLLSERDEARETLRAISSGEVDAFLVQTDDGEKVFTLKSAEHAYRVMVEAMSEGAATMLQDGTIIYCNNKFAELLLQTPNSVCGELIWQFIAKHDAPRFALMFAQSLLKTAKGEIFLNDLSGTSIDVHVSLGPVDFNGTKAVNIIVTDLTERKQNEALIISENLTRSILDQAAEAIIVCDSDGYVTRANPEAQRLIGINPVLMPFDQAFKLLTDVGEFFPLSKIKMPDRKTRGLPVSLVQIDGTVIELSMSISHLENESVGLWHVVTLTDVTPIKKMEKFRALKDAAESASSLKTAFLANMSHEIRTPLGAIVGFAELLQAEEVNKEERTQFLEIISRSGKALTILIDDILDLSKVESGGMVVEHIDVDIHELMNDVMLLFSQKTVSKGITLSVAYEGNVPAKIKSDPSRLRQVLVNIIGNAVKFTPVGKVEVSVSIELNANGDNLMKVRVRDSGVGLSEEQQRRIFTPFTQGDSSTTRKFGGTGLGLVLSRRLAQALGGDVALESSTHGLGSVFCISVSLNDGLSLVEPVAQPTNQITIEKTEAELPLTNLKILVVDDSRDNQILFHRLFTARGANVSLASNGREGVDRAIAGEFDLVIMDIQMPILDGYGATKELRAKGYSQPIIALTAYAMQEEKERCVSLGCDAHLSKPVNVDLAIKTIKEVISKPLNRFVGRDLEAMLKLV